MTRQNCSIRDAVLLEICRAGATPVDFYMWSFFLSFQGLSSLYSIPANIVFMASNLLKKMTLRSFSSFTVSSFWFLIWCVYCWLLQPRCMTLHLDLLNGICKVSDQFVSCCRSCWSWSLSLLLLTLPSSFVSSANLTMELTRSSSKSLI